MLLPTVHDLWATFFVLFTFCVPHSLLLFSSPSTVLDVTPTCFRGRTLRSHNVRVRSRGQPLRLLRFMPQVLVSVRLLANSSVLHQKPLKNLANRMAANWNNCLVIFYVHCYIHVCMCLCGWSVGDSEKILPSNPLPPWNEVDPYDMKQYQFHAAKLTFGIILKQMIMWYCSEVIPMTFFLTA